MSPGLINPRKVRELERMAGALRALQGRGDGALRGFSRFGLGFHPVSLTAFPRRREFLPQTPGWLRVHEECPVSLFLSKYPNSK